jgi:simple sugar transport system ATP-binding protein/ribose transport system ATP-binding protein
MTSTGTGPAATLAAGPVAPLETVDLRKRFGATQALDGVSVPLAPGEVHALVGENGAGKSTLGKVMAGVYAADSGRLLVRGQPVTRWDTGRAQKHGVVLIAQELSLVPELSVAENVFLGVEPRRLGVLKRGLQARYEELERMCEFGLRPGTRLGDLRIADQQKVEIMRALARDARVLIMDEPTSSLTADEADKLHHVIARLRGQGRTVVYVTHFLDAVLSTSDRVTIMRDGRVVRTGPTADENKQSLVEGMLGRSIDVTFPDLPPMPAPDTPPLLEVRGLAGDNGVHDVSLTLRPGEIVGLAGLVGSGRSEIARLLFGIDRITSGELFVDGTPVTDVTPRRSTARGLAYIPEDRRGQGLALVRPVRENVTLPHLRRLGRAGVLARRQETREAGDLVRRVGVSPPRLDLPVGGFSGGNQQKILFARWLLGEPRLVILDEPTRGVDVGAKVTIYQLISDLAARGTALLLISSEHEEVLALSHRVYLVRDGTLHGEVDPRTTTVDDLLYQLFEVGARSDPAAPADRDGGVA